MTDNFQDLLPGEAAIVTIVDTLGKLSEGVKNALHDINLNELSNILSSAVKELEHGKHMLSTTDFWKFTNISSFTHQTLTGDMLNLALGVDTNKFDKDANSGLKTIDNFISFIIALTYGGVAVNVLSKLPLANRIPENILGPIMELPREMGLSWAIGTFMETVLEAAIGRSLEEGIAEQKRPNRVDFPVLRMALKQHLLNEAEFTKWLEKLGFPDDQIHFIKHLADLEIPVGDLQQLYFYGLLSKSDVKDRIGRLGFGENASELLTTLYVDKAQTQSSTAYRSAARTLATEQLITKTMYHAILEEVNVPEREIKDDMEALDLELTYGRLNSSLSTLKSLYTHGKINAEAVHLQLLQHGFSDSSATETIQAWDLPALTTTHHLSQSRILSYLVSKVITPDIAREHLKQIGLRPEDIELLIEHPTAATGVHMRTLSPGVVIEAYLAGALGIQDLDAAFTRAGVPSDQLDYYMAIAKYRFANRKHTAGGTKPLSEAQIIAAHKWGLYDDSTAERELRNLGYSAENAVLLLEISNKGPLGPGAPPPFKSIDTAIQYLTSHGIKVYAPSDPLIAAAENMIAQAGYTFSGYIPPHQIG